MQPKVCGDTKHDKEAVIFCIPTVLYMPTLESNSRGVFPKNWVFLYSKYDPDVFPNLFTFNLRDPTLKKYFRRSALYCWSNVIQKAKGFENTLKMR